MMYDKITLVTGAGGFIGSHIVSLLADSGVTVRATDMRAPARLPAGVQFMQADLRNRDDVTPLLEGVDRIFHVAGICNLSTPYEKLRPVNVHAVDVITELALKKQVRRFVHMSSSSVYGLYNGTAFSEEAPCRPADSYGQSKFDGETIVRRRMAEGLQAVILRPCTVYGPGCNDGAGKVFSRPSDIPGIPGNGKQKLANVRVEDVSNAAIFLSQRDDAAGHIFNVSDDSSPTLEEALRLSAQVFRSRIKPVHVPLALLKIVARVEGAVAALRGKIPDLELEAVKYLYSDYIMDNSKLKNHGYKLLFPAFDTSMQELGERLK